jgi:hypothetical protein
MGDGPRRTETDDGVEVLVHGDRDALARRVLAERAAAEAAALRLLRLYLHAGFGADRGQFDLGTIEVLAAPAEDGGDVVLRYAFTGHADPHAEGYTYFDVVLAVRDPPHDAWWPLRFTVGFW